MNEFFDSNLGLKSHFNFFIYFDNYKLIDIFSFLCRENDYVYSSKVSNLKMIIILLIEGLLEIDYFLHWIVFLLSYYIERTIHPLLFYDHL